MIVWKCSKFARLWIRSSQISRKTQEFQQKPWDSKPQSFIRRDRLVAGRYLWAYFDGSVRIFCCKITPLCKTFEIHGKWFPFFFAFWSSRKRNDSGSFCTIPSLHGHPDLTLLAAVRDDQFEHRLRWREWVEAFSRNFTLVIEQIRISSFFNVFGRFFSFSCLFLVYHRNKSIFLENRVLELEKHTKLAVILFSQDLDQALAPRDEKMAWFG